MYCEICNKLFESGDRCPYCKSRKVREPKQNDPCFLTKKGVIWEEMLEDVLRDSGIPFITKRDLGAGLAIKVGPLSERIAVYVPFSRLEEAKDIVDAFFSESTGTETDSEDHN